MVEDKYIGLALAITSTLAIGTSFVVTKKGLNDAAERHGFEGDGYTYLKSPIWWGGITTLVIGEIANFAAYAFAPAILVTPLGALSVLIGAVLGTYFLNERLGILGKLGCATCLIGSVVIVLHAPPDREITRVDELLQYAIQPGFLLYCAIVGTFAFLMIYKVSPQYGKKNPLIYLSICSTVGSISVMAIKAFGIAVKLTLGGQNQFVYPSTYVFMIVVAVCILTQMNYFNKALSQFSTNIVNPLYYVTFTTCTLVASFILFRGFNTTDAVNTLSLICGFLIIFSGVYLLNLSRDDPDGSKALAAKYEHLDGGEGGLSNGAPGVYGRRSSLGMGENGIPTDAFSAFESRRSMTLRRSSEALARRLSHSRQHSWSEQGRLMHDAENGSTPVMGHGHNGSAFGLGDLAEEDEEDSRSGRDSKTETRVRHAYVHANSFVEKGGGPPEGVGNGYESERRERSPKRSRSLDGRDDVR